MRKAEKGLMERSKEKKEFPTWKTIPLGEYRTIKELADALEKVRTKIYNRADEALEKTPLSGSPTSVELVNVSLEDLGFKEQATTQEIYDQAKELGLSLCPAEVGPVLRIHYSYIDQPINERLCIAMKPIALVYNRLGVFSVGGDLGGGLLEIYTYNSESVWDASSRWVFVRGKKK